MKMHWRAWETVKHAVCGRGATHAVLVMSECTHGVTCKKCRATQEYQAAAVERRLQATRCPSCAGHGRVHANPLVVARTVHCAVCDGSGLVVPCRSCEGSGSREACHSCQGWGVEPV